MLDNKNIELIEKYLSDNLTEEEKISFNEKFKNDKEFSEETLFRKNLKIASERIVTAEFESIMNNVHYDYLNKNYLMMFRWLGW